MSKFISESLNNTFGIGFLPAISLILFLVLFVGVIIWVIKADHKHINKMKNIPFDDNEISNNHIEQ